MKYLTKSLLATFLCFSLFFSCGGDASVDSMTSKSETKTIVKGGKDLRNPVDTLSKADKLARMNKANSANHADPTVTENDIKVKAIKKELLTKTRKIGQGQAEQTSRLRKEKFEREKNTPITSEQKNVANRICECLEKEPLFAKLKSTKTHQALFKIAGENSDKTVQAMQNCYTVNMVPAVANMGDDGFIFALKARNYLNKNCIKGSDKFWLNIGSYLARKNKPVDIEMDMTKKQ